MSESIDTLFVRLFDKSNSTAYAALQDLQKESERSDRVYRYMDKLFDMLDSDNSYIRTRGLTLIAYNSKWDKDNKIDEIIDGYLKGGIVTALKKANISGYADSMRQLIYKDIQKAVAEIEKPEQGWEG